MPFECDLGKVNVGDSWLGFRSPFSVVSFLGLLLSLCCKFLSAIDRTRVNAVTEITSF